nr:oligosaccharide flippase family protein [uncultured Desulfobulbus sp.]
MIAVAGATYLGRLSQGIAVLFTLPMARHSLHPELFGVWMMLSAFQGFMAFADLGIGNGVLNQATKAKTAGGPILLRRTLVSGYAITCMVGCLLFLAWTLWSMFSTEPTALAGSISIENRPEVLKALTIFAIILAVNIPASLIQRVQLGVQQGYLNGINQVACSLLTITVVPLTLHLGGGIPELVIATLGVQALINILNSLIWLHHFDMFNGQNWWRLADEQTVRLLLKTGGMFFLLQLAAAFAFQSDAIVITQILGQSVYGDFALVQKLFLFISMILNAAMLGLWPAFGDAIASNNLCWARMALRRGIFVAVILTTVGTGILISAMPWILEHWLQSPLQPALGLLLTLATWTVIDGVANVTAAFMNSANILRAQLSIAIVMASTAFAVKWALTPLLGATGTVLSTIIAYCLISVPGQVYIFRRILNTKE